MQQLSSFARSGIDEARQIPAVSPEPEEVYPAHQMGKTAEPKRGARLTPDIMLEILSRSFVIPVSGYYFDVEEAVFRALLDKTKEIVDLVRPHPDSPRKNMSGDFLSDPTLKKRVALKRKELEEWMNQLYDGAKQERIQSRLRYEKRAERWNKMWNGLVLEGKNQKEVLKVKPADILQCRE